MVLLSCNIFYLFFIIKNIENINYGYFKDSTHFQNKVLWHFMPLKL